jgi:hypothetical protein
MKSLPKVSLRDLLWLIVVVVLSVLLWKQSKEIASLHKQHDARRLAAEAARLEAAAERRAAEAERIAAKVRQAELMIQLQQREIAEVVSKMNSSQGSERATEP